jgi:hypothetical protein
VLQGILLLSACAGSTTSPSPIAPAAAQTAEPGPTVQPPPPQTDSASSVPAISNISASFTTNTCTRAADGLQAMALVITFDYTDSSGDLAGGKIPLSRVYNTGRSESHTYAVPTDVTVDGTPTAGQIRINNACPLYDNNSSDTESITLVDSHGNASNTLSITVSRPAGDR